MNKLFIANASARDHHLHYRIPEHERIYDVLIKAGTQVEIPKQHCGPDEIPYILKQLDQYGAVPIDSIGKEDTGFSGLIYGEKPISIDAIREGFSQVEQQAIDKALDERTKAVIAGDDAVAKLAKEAGTGVGSMELEVQEEGRPGDNPDNLQRNLIQVQRADRPVSKRSQEKATRAQRG